MKKQFIVLIALLALVSMMIAPVSAVTLTGSLGATEYVQKNQSNSGGSCGGIYTVRFVNFRTTNLENLGGTVAAIHWDDTGKNISFTGANAPYSWTAPFVGNLDTVSGVTMVSGTFGYNRVFNALGVEQPGYQWLMFNNDWNLTGTGKTGDHTIYISFTNTYGANYQCSGFVSWLSSMGAFNNDLQTGSWEATGNNVITISQSTFSTYSATKPSGLKISGLVSKNVSGTAYGSKIFIADLNGNTVASEGLTNTNDYPFNVANEQIYIKMLSGQGVWYNSSLLFTPTVPTVTPTPGPTVPPGYVRNNLYIWDQNDAQISGADVDVRDVEAGTWTNTTTDADGWITIDTLPYHTVNVYAHYPTAGIYLPNEILGLETGYYGGHNWVLVLYPYVTTPSGFVTLYINARNYDTKAVLTGVDLQIKNLVTGVTTGESTGSTDSVSTVVTNATNYQITGGKSGYISKTININSGEASSKTVVIELSKSTVTPTVTGTPLPGEITARPTYAPGCDPAAYDAAVCTRGKDSDMMNQIRDAGPGLIALAIIATVVGLIKLMSKR